jgi:hypothetical protein
MCTTIAEKFPIAGSGKGPRGWFSLGQLYVGYDHPFHAPYDHALSLNFVDEAGGPGARVAVELSRADARELAERILATLERADAIGD